MPSPGAWQAMHWWRLAARWSRSLLDAMQHGEHLARLEAVRALAKIGDQRAIPALFEALDDSSALIEYWASEGLEKMGVGMVFYKPE